MSRNVVITALSRSAMVVAGFVSSIITARVLGPTGRGDFFFVVTLSATVAQFANLGLHSSNTYLVSRDRSLLGPLLANSLWTSLMVGVSGSVATVVVLRVTNLIPNAPNADLWYVVALVPPLLFFLLGANLLVGVERIGTFNVIEAAARLLVLVAFAVAALIVARAGPFLLASAIAWTLSSAVLLAVLMRASRAPLRFDRAVFGTGFRYAAKAYVAALLGFLVLRANVFLLERMTTAGEVGYFSVSAQIADALGIIPTSVALVLFPDLVRDSRRRWALTIRSCVIVVIILSAACALVAVAAGPLIRVVYGNGFAPAVGILRWLLPGVVALGATSVISQYLAAIGIPRIVLGIWASALACVTVLGFFLIRRNGGAGAAVALSLTYVAVFALMLLLAHRFRSILARDEDPPPPTFPHVDPEPETPWL